MKKVLFVLALFAMAFASQANIIVDPTFVAYTNSTAMDNSEIDVWHITEARFDIASETVTSKDQWGGYYFFQSISDGGATTGVQDFSFDWTANLAWNAANDLILYDVYGATADWSGTFNDAATGIPNDGLDPKPGVTSLLSGSLTGFATTDSGSFSTTVDFGSGYDVIIVRFGTDIKGPSTAVASFTNPSLGSAVPEPATVGMLGLGSVIALLFRRIRS